MVLNAEGGVLIRMREEGGAATAAGIAPVARELEGVDVAAGKASKSSGKMTGALSGLKNMAKLAALGGLAVGIDDVAKNTVAFTSAQSLLARSLKNSHQPVNASLSMMSEHADKLSTSGGFGAAQNVQAMTAFTTAGIGAKKSMDDLNLATDVARARNIGLTRVMRAMIMAETGHATSLASLGVTVPAVTTATDKLKASTTTATPAQLKAAKAADKQSTSLIALRELHRKYAGEAQTYSKSVQGSWSDLEHEFDVVEVNLGKKFLPMISSVIKFMAEHKTVVVTLVAVVATLTAAYLVLAGAMKVYKLWQDLSKVATEANTKAQAALDAVMDANPILLVILAIVALVAIFVVLWVKCKWFRDFWIGLWHDLLDGIQFVWKWIKKEWPLLAGILFGPIGFAVAEIIKHWSTLKKLPGILLNALKQGWKAVVSFFGSMVKDAVNLGKNIVKAIVNELKHLPGQALNILKKVPILGSAIGAGQAAVGGVKSAVSGAVHFAEHPFGLAGGGTVASTGAFMVGEHGPELVNLPAGASVSSNDDLSQISNLLEQLIAAVQAQDLSLNVDGQRLAQAVTRASTRQLATR